MTRVRLRSGASDDNKDGEQRRRSFLCCDTVFEKRCQNLAVSDCVDLYGVALVENVHTRASEFHRRRDVYLTSGIRILLCICPIRAPGFASQSRTDPAPRHAHKVTPISLTVVLLWLRFSSFAPWHAHPSSHMTPHFGRTDGEPRRHDRVCFGSERRVHWPAHGTW